MIELIESIFGYRAMPTARHLAQVPPPVSRHLHMSLHLRRQEGRRGTEICHKESTSKVLDFCFYCFRWVCWTIYLASCTGADCILDEAEYLYMGLVGDQSAGWDWGWGRVPINNSRLVL
eukprot:COSAG02_NODE_2295_length_9197_cov_20.855463_3_plen_119_part_00